MLLDIKEIFKKEKLPTVLLMFGEEEFLLYEALDYLLKNLGSLSNLEYDFEAFEGEEIDLDKLINCCNTFPFVSEKRIVLVRNFDKLVPIRISKKNADNLPLTKYLNNPQDTTFLILISQYSELNKISEEFKKSKDSGKKIQSLKYPYDILIGKFEWIEFPKVYESQLPEWVTKRLLNYNKKIDPNALEFLLASTNPNLRDLNNEIEKLVIYTKEKNNIIIDDVRFLVGASRNYNIFELQKAIGKRNLKDALFILHNMLNVEKQQILIITMLVRYFIALFKLIELVDKINNQYQLSSAIGVNAYFLNDYKIALNNYTKKEIDSAFYYLIEADEQLKSSATDALYVLQKMLINIMDNK